MLFFSDFHPCQTSLFDIFSVAWNIHMWYSLNLTDLASQMQSISNKSKKDVKFSNLRGLGCLPIHRVNTWSRR